MDADTDKGSPEIDQPRGRKKVDLSKRCKSNAYTCPNIPDPMPGDGYCRECRPANFPMARLERQAVDHPQRGRIHSPSVPKRRTCMTCHVEKKMTTFPKVEGERLMICADCHRRREDAEAAMLMHQSAVVDAPAQLNEPSYWTTVDITADGTQSSPVEQPITEETPPLAVAAIVERDESVLTQADQPTNTEPLLPVAQPQLANMELVVTVEPTYGLERCSVRQLLPGGLVTAVVRGLAPIKPPTAHERVFIAWSSAGRALLGGVDYATALAACNAAASSADESAAEEQPAAHREPTPAAADEQDRCIVCKHDFPTREMNRAGYTSSGKIKRRCKGCSQASNAKYNSKKNKEQVATGEVIPAGEQPVPASAADQEVGAGEYKLISAAEREAGISQARIRTAVEDGKVATITSRQGKLVRYADVLALL